VISIVLVIYRTNSREQRLTEWRRVS